MLNEQQERELTTGGVCRLHVHDDERLLNARDLHQLNAIERVVTVTTSYTAQVHDDIILVNTTSGGVTVTLNSSLLGAKYVIIRVSGSNNVIVQPSSGTINGSASETISSSYTPKRVKCIAGNYYSV